MTTTSLSVVRDRVNDLYKPMYKQVFTTLSVANDMATCHDRSSLCPRAVEVEKVHKFALILALLVLPGIRIWPNCAGSTECEVLSGALKSVRMTNADDHAGC